MNIAISIIASIILFLPSYVANPSAVLTGGKLILDRGKSIGGKRILGDHKTLSGFLGGAFFGFLTGTIIDLLGKFWKPIQYSAYPLTAIEMVLVLSLGSMIGDLIGSFIKRRIGLEPGREALFLDQYPFAITSLALFYVFFPAEFIKTFPPPGLITILVLTPILHRAVNIIGFKMKLKDVPY